MQEKLMAFARNSFQCTTLLTSIARCSWFIMKYIKKLEFQLYFEFWKKLESEQFENFIYHHRMLTVNLFTENLHAGSEIIKFVHYDTQLPLDPKKLHIWWRENFRPYKKLKRLQLHQNNTKVYFRICCVFKICLSTNISLELSSSTTWNISLEKMLR